MTILIACLSTGKGTWGHVSRVIQDGEFEKVILITNDYGKENFNKSDKTELIAIKLEQGITDLREEIFKELKSGIKTNTALERPRAVYREKFTQKRLPLRLRPDICPLVEVMHDARHEALRLRILHNEHFSAGLQNPLHLRERAPALLEREVMQYADH